MQKGVSQSQLKMADGEDGDMTELKTDGSILTDESPSKNLNGKLIIAFR